MGEAVEATHSPGAQATCLSCGVALGRFSSGVEGRCVACSALVLTESARVTPPHGNGNGNGNGNGVGIEIGNARETSYPKQPTLPRMHRSREALANLIAKGPSTEAPAMVGELLRADKRISSFMALVPFVGPWLIQRSEAHSPKEKFWLTWISISLTSLALFGLVSTSPTPEDRLADLHKRIDRETKALGDFADRYRRDHSAYANKATWKRFADRADRRFFDPWGRPYRYEPSTNDVTIGTLGRDGIEGGSDEDADFSAHFPPTQGDQPAR
jgi:hypothetical protein